MHGIPGQPSAVVRVCACRSPAGSPSRAMRTGARLCRTGAAGRAFRCREEDGAAAAGNLTVPSGYPSCRAMPRAPMTLPRASRSDRAPALARERAAVGIADRVSEGEGKRSTGQDRETPFPNAGPSGRRRRSGPGSRPRGPDDRLCPPGDGRRPTVFPASARSRRTPRFAVGPARGGAYLRPNRRSISASFRCT